MMLRKMAFVVAVVMGANVAWAQVPFVYWFWTQDMLP